MATAEQAQPDLVTALDRASEELRRKREAWERSLDDRRKELEASFENERQQFEYRGQMLQQARDGLAMAFGDEILIPETASDDDDTETIKLSISERHLKAIEEYLASHGKARQADLVDRLDLNSGTVSVGLRRLEQAGLITKAAKERGSRVWEHTAPSDKKRREMVLVAGEGAHEGRQIKG